MSQNNKPRVAFFDFTCCEGCQLTVVDSLQTHPELLDVIDIVQFREAMSEKSDDYQVAFIEGSCSRPATRSGSNTSVSGPPSWSRSGRAPTSAA